MSSWLWIKGIGRPRVSYCGGLLSLAPGWMVSYVFGVGGSPSPVLSAVLLKSVECSILPTCALPGLSPSSCPFGSLPCLLCLSLCFPSFSPFPPPVFHAPLNRITPFTSPTSIQYSVPKSSLVNGMSPLHDCDICVKYVSSDTSSTGHSRHQKQCLSLPVHHQATIAMA